MYVLTVIFAIVTAGLFAFTGGSKIAGLRQQVDSAAHLGIPWDRYRLVGVAEVLGALGLLIGLWLGWLGVLAALCLLVLMVGALVVHARAGDPPPVLAPAAVAGVLALVTLILRLVS